MTVVFCDLTGSTALGDGTDPEALRATMRGVLRRDADDPRAARRDGREVHRRCGDGGVRRPGLARGRCAARRARRVGDARGRSDARPAGAHRRQHRRGRRRRRRLARHRRRGQRRGAARAGGDRGRGADRRRDATARPRRGRRSSPSRSTPRERRPVDAFRLVDVDLEAAAIARRLDTPLVGRARELEQLQQAFERTVREQRCHLFTLLGAAGVGKSRLVAEFLAEVDAHSRRRSLPRLRRGHHVLAGRRGLQGSSARGRTPTLARIVEGGIDAERALLGRPRRSSRRSRRSGRSSSSSTTSSGARRRSSTSSTTSPTSRAARRSCCSASRGRSCSTSGPAGAAAS